MWIGNLICVVLEDCIMVLEGGIVVLVVGLGYVV